MSLTYRWLFLLAVAPASLAMAQDSGDAGRGRALFAAKACAACHAVDGRRDSLGPDLSKLEQKPTRDALLEAMNDPDKKIREGYDTWIVLTSEGRVLTGRLVRETPQDVELLVTEANQVRPRRIARDQIDEMRKSPTSIMPKGLLKGMSDSEVGDLLAYLHSLPDAKPFGEDLSILPSGAATTTDIAYTPIVNPDTRPRFDQPDQEVTITTVPAQMRYDITTFTVRPGAKVRLTLRNADDMHHNLILCKSGKLTWYDVAQQAWALGPDGPAKEYVPKSDLILAATRMVMHHQLDSIDFEAPREEGVYPFVCTMPGHAFLMRGEMLVTSGKLGLEDARYAYYEGQWSRIPDYAQLTPVKSGPCSDNLFDISVRNRNDQFGFLFEGTLHVPVDGDYTFYISSDDGSRIELDERIVVDFDGLHSDSEQRSAKVPLMKGAYRLRIPMFELSGGEVLHAAWTGPGFKLQPLTRNTPPNRFQNLIDFQLQVGSEARVVRVNMPDASSRAIAVGLPGGVNYCFDAQTCEVRYGWTGAFLDVGPDRGNGRDRGGAVCRILGQRFDVGAAGFPLRFGQIEPVPDVRFLGYRRNTLGPTFSFQVDDAIVRQTISAAPAERGLRYHFALEPVAGKSLPAEPVLFVVKPEGLNPSSSAGQWRDGVLTVPAEQARDFTVTIHSQMP